MKLRQKLLVSILVFTSIFMCGCSKDVQKQQKTAEKADIKERLVSASYRILSGLYPMMSM